MYFFIYLYVNEEGGFNICLFSYQLLFIYLIIYLFIYFPIFQYLF